MQQVNAKRQWTGFTPVSVIAVSLALMIERAMVSWEPRSGSTRVSARNQGLLPKNLRSFPQSSRGESSRFDTPSTPMQRLSPVTTVPRLASRSAPCGRELFMRTCISRHHRPAGVAGSPSSKGKSTSSMLTIAPMATTAILLVYAVELPSLGKRKTTSMRSERDKLLKP